MTQNLLILGDSISNGYGVLPEQAYPQLLAQRYVQDGKSVFIQNSSFNGAMTDTAGGLVVNALTSANKPNYAIILLGINDAFYNVPLAQLQQNFSLAISKLQNNGVKILLGGVDLSNLKPAYALTIVQAYQYIINLFSAVTPDVVMTADILKNYTIDGIHPNTAGHQMIYQNVFSQLASMGF